MKQANPALRGQLPQFMRRMADPQNVQALAQMQQSMEQLQRAGMLPPGMMPGAPGAGGRTPPAAGGLDFSTLLGGAGAANNPWAAAPPASSSSSSSSPSSNTTTPSATAATPTPSASTAPPVANPEETYAAQLTQMNDMGFTDRAACVRALVASQGNVNMAVERMLGGGV
ncbi:unnamed protein product [Ectocarpus sp. 12 AP-2014]